MLRGEPSQPARLGVGAGTGDRLDGLAELLPRQVLGDVDLADEPTRSWPSMTGGRRTPWSALALFGALAAVRLGLAEEFGQVAVAVAVRGIVAFPVVEAVVGLGTAYVPGPTPCCRLKWPESKFVLRKFSQGRACPEIRSEHRFANFDHRLVRWQKGWVMQPWLVPTLRADANKDHQ
jgi:hypothetical protein